MRSDLSAREKAAEELREGNAVVTEAYFYDTYKLRLCSMCAFTTSQLASWRSRLEMREEHLLPAFDVNLSLSVRQVLVSSLPEFMYGYRT